MKRKLTLLGILFSANIFCQENKAQMTCTLTINYTPPTGFGMCNASASVTSGSSCAMTYTWIPGGWTSWSVSGLCAGTYTVFANDGGGTGCCGPLTQTVVIPNGPTSVNQLSYISEKAYFDTNTNTLFLNKVASKTEIYITDILGKSISTFEIEKEQKEINLDYLEKEIYIVTIVADGKKQQLKIVKN